MIEIAICDDKAQSIDTVTTMLKDYFSAKDSRYHITAFSSPSTLFTYMSEHTVNILFMDLEFGLKEEDGILWSGKIHDAFPNTLVLILTAYESRYKEGYIARAYRFMTKPLLLQEFEQNMDDCLEELVSLQTVFIARQNVTYPILLKDILYLEAYAGGAALCTEHNIFYCDESLLHWEKTLPATLFFRIHKKYLINLEHVSSLENHIVIMDNSQKLPVSRRKWTAFQTSYIKFNVNR